MDAPLKPVFYEMAFSAPPSDDLGFDDKTSVVVVAELFGNIVGLFAVVGCCTDWDRNFILR